MVKEVLAECSDLLVRAGKKCYLELCLSEIKTPGINDRSHVSLNDNLYFLPRQPKL